MMKSNKSWILSGILMKQCAIQSKDQNRCISYRNNMGRGPNGAVVLCWGIRRENIIIVVLFESVQFENSPLLIHVVNRLHFLVEQEVKDYEEKALKKNIEEITNFRTFKISLKREAKVTYCDLYNNISREDCFTLFLLFIRSCILNELSFGSAAKAGLCDKRR